LDEGLCDEPGIDERIIGVDETARAAGVFAPTPDEAELF
jgi:hypothetical protein